MKTIIAVILLFIFGTMINLPWEFFVGVGAIGILSEIVKILLDMDELGDDEMKCKSCRYGLLNKDTRFGKYKCKRNNSVIVVCDKCKFYERKN